MSNALSELFVDIANAIRSKNGTNNNYYPNQMAEAIRNLEIQPSLAMQPSLEIQPSLQSKSVTPSESPQTITPDSNYDGLSKVEVSAISSTYVGSGVTRKSVATYIPTTTDQTIGSGVYLSGAQTIAGDTNLKSDNILSTATIFGVKGNVVIQKYYTGSNEPSNSLGNDGDLYLMM